MQEQINEIFREILMHPFSSATACYRLINQNTLHIGFDCHEQAKKLKEKLKQANIDSYYLTDEIKQQHCTLVSKSQAYLFEPYFLHNSPIKLPSQNSQISVPTLPLYENTELIVRRKNQKLQVSRIANNQTQFRNETFIYDLSKSIDTELNNQELEEIILKNRIQPMIRTIDNNLQIRQIFYFPKRNCFKTSSKNGFSKEDSNDFKKDLQTICFQTNTNPQELKDYLTKAYEIWTQKKQTYQRTSTSLK